MNRMGPYQQRLAPDRSDPTSDWPRTRRVVLRLSLWRRWGNWRDRRSGNAPARLSISPGRGPARGMRSRRAVGDHIVCVSVKPNVEMEKGLTWTASESRLAVISVASTSGPMLECAPARVCCVLQPLHAPDELLVCAASWGHRQPGPDLSVHSPRIEPKDLRLRLPQGRGYPCTASSESRPGRE